MKESEMRKIPRIARKYLNTSFFHVIVQGIGKEYIFKNEIYIRQYLKLINKYSKELNIIIIAYCMMNNHAHFLIETEHKEKMSQLMQKTNSIFAKYYNYKENERVGYVFRDRFLSEPITDLKYLVQCIKYIHLNPVKAHMVERCEDYQYSSYKEFMKEYIIKTNKEIGLTLEDYKNICNNRENIYNFMDINNKISIEEEIKKFLKEKNKKLIEIFDDRDVLKQLIKYLKENSKMKYTDIMKKLDITKGTMERLK